MYPNRVVFIKAFLVPIILVLSQSACSSFVTSAQGVPIGDGNYKYITGGDSKAEAFTLAIGIMRTTCGYEGVQYEIIEQIVEHGGKVISRETSNKQSGIGVGDIFSKTDVEVKHENFRGYDITTIFKCVPMKHNKPIKQD